MDSLSNFDQYLIYGLGALGVTLLVLWRYNAREKRRKHALELAALMNQWGLSWFADAYECYAVGDYSGLANKVKEVISAVRTDEMMVSKLKDVALKVVTYASDNDQTLADQFRKALSKQVPVEPAPPSVPLK